MGYLVVKDPINSQLADRKVEVPGVLGSNILRDMKHCLQETYGEHYDRKLEQTGLLQILALYEEVAVSPVEEKVKQVRVAGKLPVLISSRSVKVIEGSAMAPPAGQWEVLIEEMYGDVSHLPNGIAIAPGLVAQTETGKMPVQIINMSENDTFLQPKTPIAILSEVLETNLPAEDASSVNVNEIVSELVTTSSTQQMEELLKRIEIDENLDSSSHQKLISTLETYQTAFSKDEDDLGFCADIEHKMYTHNNIPVEVPHITGKK